jgi:hypothetical protein
MSFLGLTSHERIERVLPTRSSNTVYHDYFVGDVVSINNDELEVVDCYGQTIRVIMLFAEIIGRDQPAGEEAHLFFEDKLLGKRVHIPWRHLYERSLLGARRIRAGTLHRANILLADMESLDDLLVKNGYAVSLDACRSASNGYEFFAKSQGYGHWGSSKRPVPPDIWRKMKTSLISRLYYRLSKGYSLKLR